MLVSMLGGIRKGDFTGAVDRPGAINQAILRRHVLFLDEIQNLDDTGQQILLPLLDLPNRIFGGLTSTAIAITRPLHIIMGTNAPIEHGKWQQHFRSDLWYRMSQVHLHLPPLRNRGPEVIYRYLSRMLASEGLPAPEEILDIELLERITHREWAGNLRELNHFTTRAAGLFRTRGRRLGMGELHGLLPEGEGSLVVRNDELDRTTLLNALAQHNYKQNLAAKALGLTPSTLNKKLKTLNLIEEVRRLRKEKGGNKDEE